MTLPTPSLDDRTFQQLVDEAKRRIPDLIPEWTDHNVSDPGVAMIELFAWMTESFLYRLNQVPDRLYVKFLELMGITLHPPAPARAVLTFRLSAPQEEPVLVPAGAEVATLQTSDNPAIVFHTTRELEIVPPRLVACLTAVGGRAAPFVDHWDDLRFDQRSVVCFPSLQPGDAIYFGFENTLRDNLIRLTLVASTEGVGVRPEDPPLVWEISESDAWTAAELVADGTGGLNRSGDVLLQLPESHDAVTLGNRRAHWIRARLLAAREGQEPYRRSPEIRSLLPTSMGGAVEATHGERVRMESLGVSDGRASQTFRTQETPVLPREDGQTIMLRFPEGGTELWEEVEDFGASSPVDKHFTWDGASGEVRFGPRVRLADGTERQYGAIPPEHAEVIATAYLYGGGRTGNVPTNQLTILRSTIPFVDTVTNRRPAGGGVEGETVEQAKARGPASLRSGQRAVTARDFELLAHEASPQVARARALPPAEPGGPVRLIIVPGLGGRGRSTLEDLTLSEYLYRSVATHVDAHRLLGTSLEIGSPRYLGVSVVARIEVQAGRDMELTRQRALDALYRDLDPVIGGPDRRGWPWDRPLTVPHVYSVLSAVDGVAGVEDVLLFEANEVTGERSPQGLQRIPLERDALWFSVRHVVM